ncbi:hypothetical protein V8D89_002487 [Ganoderma adspersum]
MFTLSPYPPPPRCFNEPDTSTSANTDPAPAAQQCMQYIQPFEGRTTLVSPAITKSASSGSGTDLLDSFLTACTALGDFKLSYNQSYIANVGTRYRRPPLLLTEISASGMVVEYEASLERLIPFLDGLAFVNAFSGPFVIDDGSLAEPRSTYASTQ